MGGGLSAARPCHVIPATEPEEVLIWSSTPLRRTMVSAISTTEFLATFQALGTCKAGRVTTQMHPASTAIQFLPNDKPCSFLADIDRATDTGRAEFDHLYRLET